MIIGLLTSFNAYMLWWIIKAPKPICLCFLFVQPLSRDSTKFIKETRQQEKGLCVTKTLSLISHIYQLLIPVTCLFSRMLILMISRAIIELVGNMATKDPPGGLLY